MDITTKNSLAGIRISNVFDCGEVTFPFLWIDIYVNYYCTNLDQKSWGIFYEAQPERDIVKFAEAECAIRERLNYMGDWEDWLGLGDNPTTKVKLERVSDRVEKAFRIGLASLALTAVKYGLPCDTSLGNREDNELYAYIINRLRNSKLEGN